MDERPVSLSEHATYFIQAAVRVFGADLSSARLVEDSDQAAVVGCQLFRRIFGGRTRPDELDEQLAALAGTPDAEAAQEALDDLIRDALTADPTAADAALETLTDFFRRQARAGNVQALADLGKLLRHEGDFEGARAAYQQAIDAGRYEYLIDMAHLLRITDNGAARACLDRAMTVGNPDLTARALVALSTVLAGSGPEGHDPAGAESALLQAIATGHPDFAPSAMSHLGDLRGSRGDTEGARAAYQQAIDSGHYGWAARSRYFLANLLEEHGDLAGARDQYQRLVEVGNEYWAPQALEHLISQLRDDGDVDSLRALHRTAVQTGNWSAPEVLVTIGYLLEERGDADGARAAWEQAIDDGYRGADDLIEQMHPSPQPTAAELDELPPQFDPRNIARTGAEVLSQGLPELPEQLSYLMAIPVAYWTTEHSAVVLFLRFRPRGRQYDPAAATVIYVRTDSGWTSYSDHQRGPAFVSMSAGGFGYDPIATPSSRPHMRGSVMFESGRAYARPVTPGLPAFIQHGRAAPAVNHIALIQDGKEEIRPIDSHFGVWVICTEQFSAFRVEGRDADGSVLARISFDPDD